MPNNTKNYIVNEKRVIGEVMNYDSHSRKGLLKLYHVGDGSEFQDAVLDDRLEVVTGQNLEKDEKLAKSLTEAQYQVWRFQNRGILQSDYERIRRHLLDFDQFCRGYYVSKCKGELTEFLTSMFAECIDYFQTAFYFDTQRETIKNPER
ncbi:hypothetical protein DSQ20_07200 [Nitrosarchaeum sp. AC2]|nr:hypothetical protein DSQ20_07200 [Nitrosarchaeum sp. AC2]